MGELYLQRNGIAKDHRRPKHASQYGDERHRRQIRCEGSGEKAGEFPRSAGNRHAGRALGKPVH